MKSGHFDTSVVGFILQDHGNANDRVMNQNPKTTRFPSILTVDSDAKILLPKR